MIFKYKYPNHNMYTICKSLKINFICSLADKFSTNFNIHVHVHSIITSIHVHVYVSENVIKIWGDFGNIFWKKPWATV